MNILKIRGTSSIVALLVAMVGTFSHTSCADKKINNTSNQFKEEQNTDTMKKILVIGIDPKTIDFSNPELVPGLTVEKIEAGMKAEQEKLNRLGFKADFFLFSLTETNVSTLATHLKNSRYDGIVVGAGIRVPHNTFGLFEKVINAVHENATDARIMFNTLPTNTTEAIQRWFE